MRILLLLLVPLFVYAGDLEEGIRLFKAKHYVEAEKHFDRAIQEKDRTSVSLFGKALCHVALGDYVASGKEFKELSNTLTCSCDADTDPRTEREQALTYECRQAIRSVSNQMRTLVEKLVQETVKGVFKKIEVLRQLYPYIDILERNGIDCCENKHHWRCCAEPLVEQFEVWNSSGLSEE